jgi:hypothetical protein
MAEQSFRHRQRRKILSALGNGGYRGDHFCSLQRSTAEQKHVKLAKVGLDLAVEQRLAGLEFTHAAIACFQLNNLNECTHVQIDV